MFDRIRKYFANFGRVKKDTENLIDAAVARQKTLRRGGFLNPKYWAKGLARIAFVQRPVPAKPAGRGRKKAVPVAPEPRKLSLAGWIMILALIGLIIYLFASKSDDHAAPAPEPSPAPAAAAKEQPQPKQPRQYVVQRGDWLSKIAKRYYGDIKLYKLLQSANNIENADEIEVGQVLVIPDLQ